MKKIIRITTVPSSLQILLKGQLKFMAQYYEVIGVSSSGQELKEVELQEKVEVKAVEMTRTISPIRDLKSLIALFLFLRKQKPDIVHTHTPKAGIVGMLAAFFARVPHRLHTVAGLPLMESKGLKRTLLNSIEKLTYSCATMVYPNSKGLEDFILKNNFLPQKKLKVLGNGSSNGIDTDHFDPKLFSEEEKKHLKAKLNITADDFIFIFVGRLVGDKGINELINAYKQIKNKRTKLLLVGGLETALDPLLPDTLSTIENTADIISVGFQKDVRPYFAIANVLVFPSYREGFPNVVMQAGAMGLPAIVSDINGCNEIIINDKNGTIVPTKDAKAIEKAMLNAMKNEEWYTLCSTNSRNIIVEKYQQRVVWEALLQEYRMLLKEQNFHV